MAYTKNSWVDRVVQNPLTYTLRANGDGTTTLIPAEGTITQAGTPITANIMNNLETQYDQIAALAQMTKLTLDDSTILRPLNIDLNAMFTSGFYYYSGGTGVNGPIQQNATVEVYGFSANQALQVFTMMSILTPKRWIRYGSGGTWGAWIESETTTSGTYAKLYGLGIAPPIISDCNLDINGATGFYNCSGTTINMPSAATSGGALLHNGKATRPCQLFQDYQTNNTYTRTYTPSGWTTWANLATTTLEAWLTPVLVNGWTVYSTYTSGYYKNPFGEVKWRGYITGGTKTVGTTLFTLPTGYRPTTNLRIPAVVSGGGVPDVTLLDVLTTGEVKLVYDISSYTYIALDGISFRVV